MRFYIWTMGLDWTETEQTRQIIILAAAWNSPNKYQILMAATKRFSDQKFILIPDECLIAVH